MDLAEKVLEYWHLIETLSPNDFPEVKDNEFSKSVRLGYSKHILSIGFSTKIFNKI